MRPRLAVAAVGAVALLATVGACSKNTGSNQGSGGQGSTQSGSIATDPADSQGPAKAVSGAKTGGTLYQYAEADFDHLDPTRAYVNNATAVINLFARTLTMFKDEGNGKLKLVGDLATTPGKDVSTGTKCTSWEFTLKSGLKYEDGTPITAADVAYGVARSFSPDLAEGPHYIQQWLANDVNYNKTYKGPYNGGAPIPPGVKVSGNKITFDFKQPHCDMPFAASWGTTTPLPKAKDTRTKLDLHPFSSGPYKVQTYTRDSKLVLVRNKYWDPKTDAVRHAYFDKFETDIGQDADQQANSIKASQGKSANAVMGANVPPALIPTVQGDPAVKSRVAAGYTQFVWYMAINNQRITDLKERQALNYGFDRKSFIQTLGGSTAGDPATTLLSPTTIGFKKYDAYPYSLDKAKQLLGSKHPKLVFAFANTAQWQKRATNVQNTLQKIGFKVVLKPIDAASYYTQIGKKDNQYDLYFAGWGSDWPSGSTIIPPVFDGRNIQAQGNSTYPYFNNDSVNAQIDKLSKQTATEAAPGWAKLDKDIMTKYAPVVPVWYDKAYQLYGTNVGNMKIGQSTGWPVYFNAYLKNGK
ncbi:ABC transporter [Actinocatenispora thailandica]|uniref:ABC transporter n=1 Tax=Actinocatenispora thailandica TaxID=227318 RepID=A0A7R7DTQ2_9ACTN|nr:ABC transporter substrate-binding protein [Actinocatenispora thailandica]BCJ37664.1 ABC transporter [Actinocatenispora thailandica]